MIISSNMTLEEFLHRSDILEQYPGQDLLDLLKSAHYLQLAASLIKGESNDK